MSCNRHHLVSEEMNTTEAADKLVVEAKIEAVHHPKHYTSHPSGVECIDIIESFPHNIAAAIGYLWRHDLKGGNQDLEKAIWHIRREIGRRNSL